MRGKKDEDIRSRMKEIYDKYVEVHDDPDAILVDQFTKAVPNSIAGTEKEGPWCLGDSIKLMAMADIVIFSDDFLEARGCRIEHDICAAYNLKYTTESTLNYILYERRKNE